MKDELIPISKMAEFHGISRQTLILYDKKGLFRPAYVSESGYRYYSVYQIPYLREICFLKSLGVSLERINKYMHNPGTSQAAEMLKQLEEDVDEQLAELNKRKLHINQRRQLHRGINAKMKNTYRPYIEWCPEQKVLFVPFGKVDVDKDELHLTLMKAWDILRQHSMVPSKGFGAVLRYESYKSGEYFKQAGSIIQIPFPDEIQDVELYTLPEGEYVTMYKYGMPYDMEHVHWLMNWIDEHGYKVNGDIIDLCLLDTTFYNEEHKEDFCQLKIPICEA